MELSLESTTLPRARTETAAPPRAAMSSSLMEPDLAHRAGLRTVAVYEAIKGILVLAIGFGLLALVHRDIQALAEMWVDRFGLNPEGRYPRMFLTLADRMADTRLWLICVGAVFYSLLRFVEAYGLWMARRWAEWFALVSCAVYLPVELFELWRGISIFKLTILGINGLVVLYLAYALYSSAQVRVKANAV
jgi:uncharacterized membrane protein (DUF2068 family)